MFGCFRILGRLVDGEVESNREREGRRGVYICVCLGVKEYVFSGRREKDRGIEFVCLCLCRERYYFEETRSYFLFVCKL